MLILILFVFGWLESCLFCQTRLSSPVSQLFSQGQLATLREDYACTEGYLRKVSKGKREGEEKRGEGGAEQGEEREKEERL